MDEPAVKRLNGPGVRCTPERLPGIKAGNVVMIPAGTGHELTAIVGYLMVRVDPDKVVPSMNAQDSEAYLSEREN